MGSINAFRGRIRHSPRRAVLLTRSTPIHPPSHWIRLAARIETLADKHRQYDSTELRKESLSLRFRARSGEPTDTLIPEAFSLVIEAADRTLGLRPYPVQIQGGIGMHFGHIAVMQTGEGKTLTAIMPLYLASLTGHGAHLATANDYLAARDAELMRPVFELLGISVGVVQSSTLRPDRIAGYHCDVTYTTAKEIGFDFLRDRLLIRRRGESAQFEFSLADQPDESGMGQVQRPLNFVVIDEADSILIDEARTPLIISSLPDDEQETRSLYRWAAEQSVHFSSGTHFDFDHVSNSVNLTHQGRLLLRKSSKPESIRTVPMLDMYENIELAILARERFSQDRHYVVRDNEIMIVDEFTGRIAEGRKWRAGIHQAIEAKENLPITPETKESARITVQDLFLKYSRVSGMTGTVANSSTELTKIYGTQPVQIPTNRPPQREGLDDLVYLTAEDKWRAIVDEVKQLRSRNRPCLIGTRSIDKSETLSRLLLDAEIPHEVLNARHLEREADIVSMAGQAGCVTVATNMAGRGTDIQLSDLARDAGGLHVIISELHESARIDRQLIGRCGRQGDPGTFRFYLSLDDDILESGLGPKAAKRLRDIASRCRNLAPLAREFRQAQKKVEKRHYHGRKMLLFHERQRQDVQREMGQDPYVDTVG